MLKQHNVENAEIPRPFEEVAPEPLIQQHKAVVEAETAARLARAASNLKKERDKVILYILTFFFIIFWFLTINMYFTLLNYLNVTGNSQNKNFLCGSEEKRRKGMVHQTIFTYMLN